MDFFKKKAGGDFGVDETICRVSGGVFGDHVGGVWRSFEEEN